MRKKIVRRDVAHVWAHKLQDEARTPGRSTMFCRDGVIYSYGTHFPIARHITTRTGKPAVLFTTETYSATTRGHCWEVRRAIPAGVAVYPVADVLAEPGKAQLAEYAATIAGLVKAARNTRTRANAHHNAEDAEKAIAAANEFSAAFKLRKRFKLPKDWCAVRKAALERHAKHQKICEERVERKRCALAARHKEQLTALSLSAVTDSLGWKSNSSPPCSPRPSRKSRGLPTGRQ